MKRKQHQDKISLHCTFEIRGAGFCHYTLDQSRIIKRHTEKIRQGKLLENLLGDILFSGEGSGAIAAEGVLIGGEPLMKTVRVDFLSKSGSPVKIGLFSLRLEDNKPTHFNQLRAEISSLIFSRTEKNPKMRIKVKSVKAQAAPDSLWENFKGAIKGKLANLVIPPVSIAPVGNSTILDLAQAIYSEMPEFTFPTATNLTQ